MRFKILGPFQAWDDGQELELGAGRHRALLAYLVLHRGEIVSADRLVDELWETAPPSAAKLVQGHVSRLRRALPADSIATHDSGYLVPAAETDAAEFERLLEAASAQPPREAAKTLREALALWRGPPLPEFEYEGWAQPEVARLRELRLVGIEARIAADLQVGGAERLVPELEALAAEHPLREQLRTQLMLALYRSGRQAEALATFTDARRRLVQELGIEPGNALQEMQRKVLVHDGSLAAPVASEVAARSMPRPVLRRRSLLAAALAGVVTAAVAVPIFALSSSGSGGAREQAGVGMSAVGVVDLSTGRVVESAALTAAPSGVAYGEGSVWVTMSNEASVARIDPRTQTVEQTIPAGAGPTGIAVGGSFVWVANSLAGTVLQIDPRANGGQVVDRIAVGNGPSGVAYGLGSVWVADSVDRTVTRIDPHTGAIDTPIPVEDGADAIAVGGDAIWVTSQSAGVVSRVDPRTRSVMRISVGNGPVGVAAGAGAVWVANGQDATVSRVNPTTDRVDAVIAVGEGPSGIAVAPGAKSVWVSNKLAGTVSRIDPATNTAVKTVTVGDLPQGVALSADSAYVALQGSGTVHRGGTLTLAVPHPSNTYEAGLPKSLDPASGYTAWELLTITNDGLVGYGRAGGADGQRVVPDLAVALPTVSDGGRSYTFRLRRGIRYSTGAIVQPTDIRRGIERVLLVDDGSPPNDYFREIVGADRCRRGAKRCDLSAGIVADTASNTVVFHLRTADPDFLYKLALPLADAVPASTPLDAKLPLPATGPYLVAGYDVKRDVVRLERNPHFRLWSAAAQPDGFPDRIVERFGYTSSRSVAAVERGTADITTDGFEQTWSPAVTASLRTRYSSRLYHATIVGTTAVWLNTRLAPFDDLRVRRALNYAVDRTHLIDLAGGPDVAQVGCQLLPPNTNGYRRYCPYTVDPQPSGTYSGPDLPKARRLVAASGTKGQRVDVWFYDVPIGIRNGRYFVAVLRSLGFDAHLRTVSHGGSSWRADRQAGAGGLSSDYASANNVFSQGITCRSYAPARPDHNLNPAAFCNRRIDAEIGRARSLQTSDPPAASRLWSTIDRQVTDLAPWVVIRTQLAPDFVSRRAGNYTYCYLSALTGSTGACLDQLWVR